MDSERLAGMLAFVKRRARGVGAIIVARGGVVVSEAYFNGFTPETRHHVYSVTKSITATLVGMAIADGAIEHVRQTVLEFFPEMADAICDPGVRAITIADLLEMRTGLRWNESSFPYGSPRNSVTKMKESPDWNRYLLSRPLAIEPGARFTYNSGASHLLSALVARQTGAPAKDYAQARLFDPLNIANAEWTEDAYGITTGGWGLHLTAREMAKLGQLFLNRGTWSGKTVVPADWIAASTTKRASVISSRDLKVRLAAILWWLMRRDSLPLTKMDYGYHWWLPPFGGYAARGYGGQAIFVIPKLDLVAVTTGELSARDTYLPENLMKSFVIPAVRVG